MQIEINEGIHYLGTLCKRGHEHEGTGKSLRYKNKSACTVCQLAHSRRRYREKYWPKATHPPAGFCEICGNVSAENDHDLDFDHDHVTGAFRGWLCNRCNTGIGFLGDNVKGIKKALAYLERAEL